MIINASKIHIFSMFPNLSSLVIKQLPKATIINVVNKNNDPFPNDWKQKIVSDNELSEIKNAEIILGDAHLIGQVYEQLVNVKFVQCTYAGAEMLAEQVKRKGQVPKFPIARLGLQVFSQYMAEYTLGQILIQERDWIGAHHYQLQNTWAHKDKIAFYKSLQEITVGVLGVGSIGSEVIRALKCFKCNALGFGRRQIKPANVPVDKYFSTNELPLFLEKCNYIVNILPVTPDTKGLLGNDVLRFAKKKPIFINIGRGDIISEDDIILALDKSWISGAILDVFEIEPLPPSNRLWSHPKVTVTPHVAAPNKIDDMVNCFLDNLQRYSEEKSLTNLINWDIGY